MTRFAQSLLGAMLIRNGNDPIAALDEFATSLTGPAVAGLAAMRQGPSAAQTYGTLLRMGDDPVASLRKRADQLAEEQRVEQARIRGGDRGGGLPRSTGFHTRPDAAYMLSKEGLAGRARRVRRGPCEGPHRQEGGLQGQPEHRGHRQHRVPLQADRQWHGGDHHPAVAHDPHLRGGQAEGPRLPGGGGSALEERDGARRGRRRHER